jgi:hypothetical protein
VKAHGRRQRSGEKPRYSSFLFSPSPHRGRRGISTIAAKPLPLNAIRRNSPPTEFWGELQPEQTAAGAQRQSNRQRDRHSACQHGCWRAECPLPFLAPACREGGSAGHEVTGGADPGRHAVPRSGRRPEERLACTQALPPFPSLYWATTEMAEGSGAGRLQNGSGSVERLFGRKTLSGWPGA